MDCDVWWEEACGLETVHWCLYICWSFLYFCIVVFPFFLVLFYLHKPWRRRQDLQGFSSVIAKSIKFCQVYIFRWRSAVFFFLCFFRDRKQTENQKTSNSVPEDRWQHFNTRFRKWRKNLSLCASDTNVASIRLDCDVWSEAWGLETVHWYECICWHFFVFYIVHFSWLIFRNIFFWGFNCCFCFSRLFLHYFICKGNWQQGFSSANAIIMKLYAHYIFWHSAVFRPFLWFFRKKKPPNSVAADSLHGRQHFNRRFRKCAKNLGFCAGDTNVVSIRMDCDDWSDGLRLGNCAMVRVCLLIFLVLSVLAFNC